MRDEAFLRLAAAAVLAALLACPEFASASQRQDGAAKLARASFVPEPPIVDGELGDPQWAAAPPLTDFRQRDPREGAPASEATEVRILYTAEALFVGVRCLDARPDAIRATERRRDASLDSDDAFWLVLDTAHDHRNSYFFQTNPLGTQWDAIVSDEGKLENTEWDGRWEVSARVEDWGWAAELRIPFSTLRVPDRENTVWGVDFRRFIRRKNEVVSWSNFRRDFSFLEVSQAGDLTGLSELGDENVFTVQPYAAAGIVSESTDSGHSRETSPDAGLEELRYGITPNLNLNLTANPDFAQAEVDDFRINLTRFPLFFEEKRAFFLEDAGLFEFGTGEEEVLLLHTRRIGLTDAREPVPILYGARLSGQPNGWNLGVMNVQTRSEAGSPARNYGVYRVKRSLFQRSYVGVMSTSVLGEEAADNVTLGVDGHFLFLDNFSLQTFAIRSSTTGDPRGDAYGAMPFRVGWSSDLLELEAEHLVIDANFDPAAGFVRRTGVRQSSAEIGLAPRPATSWLRQVELSAEVDYVTDMDGLLLTRDQSVGFQLDFESGDAVELELTRNYELLDEAFFLPGEIAVEPGSYVSDQLSLEVHPYEGRPVSGYYALSWEEFWGGRRVSVNLGPEIRWSDWILTELDFEVEDVSLPAGGFRSHVVNAVAHVNLSNQWLTSTTLQYSSLDEVWGFNFRLNYIYRTGDDLFVVANRSRTPEGSFWSLFVKLTHTFEL